MGLRINNNLEAQNALRQLNINQMSFSKSMQRISSGKRINSAADDAAGYAISNKLNAQANGLNQASSNAQDGISMIQTASGGLQTTQDMLQRLRQLAVQSANDTNTSSDRQALQGEADQINQEITQIATTTQFNTKNLLDGSLGSTGTLSSSNVIPGAVGSTATANAGSLATGTYTITLGAGTAGDVAKTTGNGATAVTNSTLLSTGNGTALAAGTHSLIINGAKGNATVQLTGTESYADAVNSINQFSAQTGVTATVSTAAGTSGIVLKSNAAGSSQNFSVSGDAANTLATLGLQAAAATTTSLGAGSGVTAGTNGSATLTSANGTNIVLKADGNNFSDANTGFSLNLNSSTLNGATITAGSNDTGTIQVTNSSANLQVGANAGQSIAVNVGDMRSLALGVQGASANQALDISSSSTAASAAITKIDAAIATVSAQSSNLGSVQNRLSSAMSNLAIGSENMTAAYSAITNVNMAQESTSLATAQILQQAATSMLAQANQAPQGVLKLLG